MVHRLHVYFSVIRCVMDNNSQHASRSKSSGHRLHLSYKNLTMNSQIMSVSRSINQSKICNLPLPEEAPCAPDLPCGRLGPAGRCPEAARHSDPSSLQLPVHHETPSCLDPQGIHNESLHFSDLKYQTKSALQYVFDINYLGPMFVLNRLCNLKICFPFPQIDLKTRRLQQFRFSCSRFELVWGTVT